MNLRTLVALAGLAQVALALVSPAIPLLLDWRGQLAVLRPLLRQVFWTYAAYILAINLWFGVVSLFLAGALLDGSPLASAVTGLIACYWLGRLLIQFFYFDRSDHPSGVVFVLGELLLVALFVCLTLIYGAAAIHNACGSAP